MEHRVQEKDVAALGAASVRECVASLVDAALQQEQQRVLVVKQERLQVEKTQEQQNGKHEQECMGERNVVQGQKQEEEVVVRVSQEQQQREKTMLEPQEQQQLQLSEMEGGRGVGGKGREELFLTSLSAKGNMEPQQKGGGPERYHRRKGELCEEEEEEEQQQFPSTVDSVASSTTSGNARGGTRTVAGFARSSTDGGTAASISQFACAQAVRSISSTPLLTAGAAGDTPLSVAAFCDATAAPPLQLPLPAPITKKEELQAAAGGAGTSLARGEAGEGGVTLTAAVAEEARGGAAGTASGTKEEEEQVKEQRGGGLRGGAGTLVETHETRSGTPGGLAAGAEVAGAEAAAAASAEVGTGGGRGGQGGTEAAAKTAADERDTRGNVTTGKDETAAHLSFRVQSRRKQSVAEQGRIAAAAVAAATRLFNRGEGANSSSPRMQHQQQQSGGMGRGENGRSFSLAVAGPTSYGFPRLLREQHDQQQQGKGLHQEDEERRWRQHMQQQQEKRLHLFDVEGQEQQQAQELQQQQPTEEKEQGEREQAQQESSHSLAIQFFAAELQEEERKMLKAFCGEEEEEVAAMEDSSALLLSHADMLFSNGSSGEVGQREPAQMDRLWNRSRSEGEQCKELLLGKECISSSSSPLYSLLQQQQKDAPALLISAAALQHDTSTKNSSLAAFSPRKLSPAGGFFQAAVAASRDITVATAAARDEAAPMTREEAVTQEAGRGVLGGGREDEELSTNYAGLFQSTEGEETETSGGLPAQLPTSSERDVVLSLIDLPRVLSLATQGSPSLKAATYAREQQPPVLPLAKPSSSAGVAAASPSASLHAHLSPASRQETSDPSVLHQQPFLRAGAAAVAAAAAAEKDVVGAQAAPAACLPRELPPAAGQDGGAAATPPSPVRSFCLQAAMRPPPGFDTKAGEWPTTQKVEQARHCNSDASGASTAAATTAGALGSATAAKKQTPCPAAALFANATQESLAAAVAVLAAVAATPGVGSGAAGSTEAGYGGESTGAACARDPMLSVGHPFGAAAAAGTAAGGDLVSSCGHINAGTALPSASPYSRGSSSLLTHREGRGTPDSCRSGSLLDTASKELLLAALTREAAAAATAAGVSSKVGGGGRTGAAGGGPGGSALAAVAVARQAAALAARVGERHQPGNGGGGAGAAASVAAGRFFTGEATGGGKGSSRPDFRSCQGGLRSVSAGENDNRTGALLLGKQQQLLPLPKHRNAQQQQERIYVPRRGGAESGGSLRLFGSAAEARGGTEGRSVTEERAVTEGRTAQAEGGRASGCGSSSFSSYGGRGMYSGTTNGNSGGSRHAWLRKGEYLELLQQQQQQLQHGSNSRGGYGRGQGERNSRRAAAAAGREKLAHEPKKDGFKVFFGNASALTTEEEMYGLFRQFGECSELILLRDRRQRLRGAGFVTFKNAADAMRAIEGLDRKYTVLGGTKPLEVRIPENSEQKRERIRALARLRAENAQQQSQEQQQQLQQQQQHGNQQEQQEYNRQQQQLGYSPQQQYTQQRYSFSQPYNSGGSRHPQYTSPSQRQQFAQQQHHPYAAQQQQPHGYHEQQPRGAPGQRAQQQHAYYYDQRQRRRTSLQRAQGYVLGNACERGKEENRQEMMWQAADTGLREAAHRSGGSSPKQEKLEAPASAAVSHSAAALEALLVVAAAQHQKQQRQQDYKNRASAENTADGAQELLAWVQGYARREDGSGFAAFGDQQQQQQTEQQPHLPQQKEGYPTASKLAPSLFHAPGSAAFCSNTLHAGSPVGHSAAPGGAAAAAAGERGEEQGICRDTRTFAPVLSQGCPPSLALNQALAAAFPSSASASANGVLFERMSSSSETPAGEPLWQDPPLSGIDQKTGGSYLPRPTATARVSRGDALSTESVGAGFPSIASVIAADGTAAEDAHPRNGAVSPSCEEPGLAYINAVANMLSSRNTCLSSPCTERESVADSGSSRAVASRYGTSPCAYSQVPASDAASVLQSAAGGSPAAPSPFVPPFSAVEKSNPVNGDVYDSKTAAAGTALSTLEGLRFSPSQQQEGGTRFPPDLLCGAGKVSESWIKKLSLLRETD